MTTTAPPPDDEPGPRNGRKAERQFGWQDTFIGNDVDPRGLGGIFVHHRDEFTLLAGSLHDYRLTLELK